MHPVLVSFGPLVLFSYSLFVVVAWAVFSFLFWRALKDEGVDDERIFNITFFATVYAFIASRLTYVLLHWSDFQSNFLRVIALWVAPGMTFYGGLIAGVGTMLIMARRSRVRVGQIMDAVALSLPVAAFFGAIGTLLDGTVIGKLTALPWAVSYVGHAGARHPVELYDALFYLMLAVAVYIIRHRISRHRQGMTAIWFFLAFAVGEFLLEFLKDSRVYWAQLTLNQWVLLAIFSESAGVLYVNGGGKEWMIGNMRRSLVFVGRQVRSVYDRFSKGRHRQQQKEA